MTERAYKMSDIEPAQTRGEKRDKKRNKKKNAHVVDGAGLKTIVIKLKAKKP